MSRAPVRQAGREPRARALQEPRYVAPHVLRGKEGEGSKATARRRQCGGASISPVRVSSSPFRGLRITQRARGREQLAGLEKGLEAGQDHRPAAVELAVRVLAELVVGDGQPA